MDKLPPVNPDGVIDLSKLGQDAEVETYPCPVCGMGIPTQYTTDAAGILLALSVVMHQNSHVMHAMAENIEASLPEPDQLGQPGQECSIRWGHHYFPQGAQHCLCLAVSRPASGHLNESWLRG